MTEKEAGNERGIETHLYERCLAGGSTVAVVSLYPLWQTDHYSG